MKKVLIGSLITLFAVACGNTSNQSEKEAPVLTAEEEQVLADSLSNEIQQAKTELQKESNEKLTEIDSLLENF